MTSLRIIAAMVALVFAIITGPAAAADWYVAQNSRGQSAVIDYQPGKDWTIVSGPYKTKDEAARAGGIDPNSQTVRPISKLDQGGPLGAWYLVKHNLGQSAVVDYKPGKDWSVVSGPYKTADEAARAGGVDLQSATAVSVPRAQ